MENKRDRQFTEEEIKDKIMRSAEDIEVPDSLKPENIEKKLAQKKKKRTPVYGMIAAAACCCLVVGAAALSGRGIVGEKEVQEVHRKKLRTIQRPGRVLSLASAKDYDQIYEYVQAAAEEEEIEVWYGGWQTGRLFIPKRRRPPIRQSLIRIPMCEQKVSVKVISSRQTESICIS